MFNLLILLLIITVAGGIPFLIAFLTTHATTRENPPDRLCAQINSANTLIRTLVVLICYLLSSLAIIGSISLAISAVAMSSVFAVKQFPGASILALPAGIAIALVLLYAWYCHAAMSIGWIANRGVGKFLPVSGTIAGAISLLMLPILFYHGKPTLSDQAATLLGEIIFVLPNLLLAIYLVFFHLKHSAVAQTSPPENQ